MLREEERQEVRRTNNVKVCYIHQQYTRLNHINQTSPPCSIDGSIPSPIQNCIQFFKGKMKEKSKTDFFYSVINCGKAMVFQPLDS